MRRNITVYLGATIPDNPAFVAAVRELGTAIASRGWNLVFGGSRSGTMTILADTVLANGGTVTGVFTRALPPEFLYQGLTETLVADTVQERKAWMLERADLIVALPGSYGTWDEFFNALELAKIDMVCGRKPKPIGVLNVDGFYDGLLALIERSLETGYTHARYTKLLQVSDTVNELLELLENNLRTE